MGLQSSTGGEREMNTWGAAGEAKEKPSPGPASHHMDLLATRSKPTCSAVHQASTQPLTSLMPTAPLSEGFISLSRWEDRIIAGSEDEWSKSKKSLEGTVSTLTYHNLAACSRTVQTWWVLEMLMLPRTLRL